MIRSIAYIVRRDAKIILHMNNDEVIPDTLLFQRTSSDNNIPTQSFKINERPRSKAIYVSRLYQVVGTRKNKLTTQPV